MIDTLIALPTSEASKNVEFQTHEHTSTCYKKNKIMETRSRARRAAELCGILRSHNNEDSDNDNAPTDSESDHEEELEGSDEDNMYQAENIASDDDESDDDIASQEAQRMKRRRTSEIAIRGTHFKFIYGKNR
ncbi:hypothetical protein PV326_011085, partial [Microctonus aethiopoides]